MTTVTYVPIADGLIVPDTDDLIVPVVFTGVAIGADITKWHAKARRKRGDTAALFVADSVALNAGTSTVTVTFTAATLQAIFSVGASTWTGWWSLHFDLGGSTGTGETYFDQPLTINRAYQR